MRSFVKTAALGAAMALALSVPVSAKTLVFCSEGNPEGFNPQFSTTGTTFDASSRQIYNRLVEFERGTTKLIPGLAESWDVSADGKSFTFSLHKGVKFANAAPVNGREFTAADVTVAPDAVSMAMKFAVGVLNLLVPQATKIVLNELDG